mmetsp:Transcript_4938/g.13633  ORF Transcript_4938/g.13633 Transcript_4938/m.13633 type:complete len:270 (+) Transcript_4938:220-1029(+)
MVSLPDSRSALVRARPSTRCSSTHSSGQSSAMGAKYSKSGSRQLTQAARKCWTSCSEEQPESRLKGNHEGWSERRYSSSPRHTPSLHSYVPARVEQPRQWLKDGRPVLRSIHPWKAGNKWWAQWCRACSPTRSHLEPQSGQRSEHPRISDHARTLCSRRALSTFSFIRRGISGLSVKSPIRACSVSAKSLGSVILKSAVAGKRSANCRWASAESALAGTRSAWVAMKSFSSRTEQCGVGARPVTTSTRSLCSVAVWLRPHWLITSCSRW